MGFMRRRKSLAQDLVEAAHSAVEDTIERATRPGDTLAASEQTATLEALEEEHRLLSERRRHLHETIDLMDGVEHLRRDAAARLEKYKRAEQEISRQRSSLYRRIRELRLAERSHHYQ